MASVHSKGTITTLNGDDMSQFANSFEFSRELDTHEDTRFGMNSKSYKGGLRDGTASVEGFYDNAVAPNPRSIFRTALNNGVTVPMVYRPEGTGSGRPTSTVQVLVTKYDESAPVGDLITFSAEIQFSGDITDATQ